VAQAVERLLCKHEALSSLYTLVSFPSLKKVTKHLINNLKEARRQWLTPVILATWEAEIRRIMVRGQPRQKVGKTPSQPIKSWEQGHMPVIPAMQKV
jgi:hypothetical protein